MSENSIESFPEEAQEIIRSLREEAAKHRKAKSEAIAERDALKAQLDEVTPIQEQYEQLLSTHASLEDQSNKLTALLDADFSGSQARELASLVKGDAPEEWVTHAKKLGALFAPAEKNEDDSKEDKQRGYLDHTAGMATPLNVDPTVAKLQSLLG